MTTGTRYPHAPITEAVIDIQCIGVSNIDALDGVNADEASYGPGEKLFAACGQMLFVPDVNPVATASSEPLGFLFRSNDGLHIYQARMNGFTFSRLSEYTTWDEVSAEARRLWDKYRAVAKPANITRIALRYVNRLDLPLPVKDFSDYLRTAPQLSSDLPQGLTAYFMQLQLPMPDIRGACVINQTIIEPPVKPNTVALVLDIDVFRDEDLPATEARLWTQLEQLRRAKNFVFESCITDEARRLFQ